MAKLNITAKNFNITEGINAAVEEKAKKIEKMIGENSSIDVKLDTKSRKKNTKRAEITIRYSDGRRVVRSEITTDDMYKSISQAADIVTERLKKAKDKQRKRAGSDSIRIPKEEALNVPIPGFSISREKIINASAMTREEACQEAYDTDHTFYVFRDKENNNALSVVYEREEGDYGVIAIE